MVGRKRKSGKAEVKTDWRSLHGEPELVRPAGKNWSSVYVIECGGAVKVGVSNSPRSRAKTIQTGQINHVHVFGAVWLDRHDAFRVENRVHQYLRRKCHVSRGEWFHVSAVFALGSIVEEVRRLKIKGAIRDCPIGSGWCDINSEIQVA